LDDRAPTLAAFAAALPPEGARPGLGRPGARPVADANAAGLGANDEPAPLLRVEALNQYYGGSHILRNVALEAVAGEVTVILGRNGVGKTTLLKSLMGVVPVRSGRVSLAGADITHETPYQRARRGIGFVPQGREIFSRLTVQENLAMGLAYKRGGTALPNELFELFPVLKQMLHRRGGDLSGGQQQQLAIARALAAGPSLLVLDEPTEGIQPSIIKDIGRVIRMLADTGLPIDGKPQRMAIVLVEQYYDFAAELADRYLVMERGEVVQRGRGADMESEGVRARMSI
jgi:urea transport system ATP-binding protein